MEGSVAVSSGAGAGSAAISSGNGAGSGSGEPVVTHGPVESGTSTQDTSKVGDQSQQPQDQGGADDTDDFGSWGEDETGDEFGEVDDKPQEPTAKDLFAKVKEKFGDDPATLKALKKALGMTSRYAEIPGFETPEKAREVADKLQSLGGLEGIEKETGEAATLWNMLAAGDKGILDTLGKEYGEGLNKLAPAMWDRLRETDKSTWNHREAQTFMATVHQSGIANALETLQMLPGVKESPEALAQLKKIIDAVNAVGNVAATAPSRDLSPEAKKLKDKEQSLANQERQIYQQGVSAKLAPIQSKHAQNSLKEVFKGRNLSAEAKKTLIADVKKEYSELAKQDATFQQNAKALLAAGETDKFLSLCEGSLKKLMGRAASRVKRRYDGVSGYSADEKSRRQAEGQSRKETGGGSAATATIKTVPPNTPELAKIIDWNRMRAEWGGRDGAENRFQNKRQYLKKGDSKNTYSF
jgi:hypothetical protein